MERSTDEGDGSPARMTIAQAALLYLRGQELRSIKAGPVSLVELGSVALPCEGSSIIRLLRGEIRVQVVG